MHGLILLSEKTMNRDFKRTLITSLLACAFGCGATTATAADTNPAQAPSNAAATAGEQSSTIPSAQPSSPAPASAQTAPAQPGGTTTAAALDTPGASSTPSGSTQAAANGTSADGEAKRVFDLLDLNHDGVLSFEEFARATIQRQK